MPVSPRVLVTRPLPQGERTAERLRALGFTPVLAPMLKIEPITPSTLPDFGKAQAVLLTSANGANRLAAMTPIRNIKILTVGDRTAEAAISAGFSEVHSASGEGHALLDKAQDLLTPSGGAVLHIRGQHAAVEFDPLHDLGFDFQEIIAYEAVFVAELPRLARDPFPEAALLYSARTASALAEALRETAIDLSDTTFIGISAAALVPLTATGARLRVADTPNEDALLTALQAANPPTQKN